ncbi:hypothetical protein CVT24_009193 [Panaeolus cyanescens]|uniref:Cation/H+ exchanger transmembrane domain-containing protein n=1 Tax=Panaeolus cyanescens TaxID=181874 RepID=A0A409Y8R6_9AGAR|nr:hypothetical protein CVT24_009193 [Panaeolus cyanescens]
MVGPPEGTPSQVPYNPPHIEQLLTISAFLYLLPLSSGLFNYVLNAGLLGPLILGIVFGPEAANILSNDIQTAFINIGYIGLLLLIFEGGLTTDIALFIRNLGLSSLVGLTGVGVPIGFSLILLHFAFDKSLLQAFGAGAALCSTSLGTTLALMSPQMRKTRVGSVLMSAALLDDIIGLVMAAIILELASNSSSEIPPVAIIRPIFVSLAFGIFTPAIAIAMRSILRRFAAHFSWTNHLLASRIQLFFIVLSLCGFVTAAKFAGTSELFGAYLAGTFLSFVFDGYLTPNVNDGQEPQVPNPIVTEPRGGLSAKQGNNHKSNLSVDPSSTPRPSSPAPSDDAIPHPTHAAFAAYITPFLDVFLSPLFFASVGAALPIQSLFSSSSGGVSIGPRVVWRGIVYSIFMVLTKVAAGVWILVWPSSQNQNTTLPSSNGPQTPTSLQSDGQNPSKVEPKRSQSALFLGLALVARGEIALIVAQLAKPLITGPQHDDEEAFAIVLWAVLVSTIGGALGVGLLLKSRWWHDGWRGR